MGNKNMNMKKMLPLLLAIILLVQCTPGEDGMPEQQETPDPYSVDGFTQMDSLLLSDVSMPEILNMEYFDSTTVKVFKTIADGTDGQLYFAPNAMKVIETIVEILENHGSDNSDICFLVDKTGSMMDDNQMINQSMDTIISTLEKYSNTNVALAFYGDKNVDGRNWFESVDFTTDYEKIRSAWKKHRPSGGGDGPESVTDGAYKVIDELSWSSDSKRIILVLGDAPPLEAPLANHSVDDIVKQAKSKGIESNYYPVVVGFAWVETGPRKANLIAGLYPNPVVNYTNLVLTNNEPYSVEVFSMGGELIEKFETNNQKHQFNTTEYTPGIYLIRVSKTNGSESDVIRFIKE
jgi:hypothetical protein